VVLVVTFLSGVMVGRGVRAQKDPAAASEAVTLGAVADPTATLRTSPPDGATPAAQPPATPPPTPPDEDLSYSSRLEGKPGDAARVEKTAGDSKTKPLPPAPPPPASAPAAAPAAPAANGEPPGPGYAVRVAAYKGRSQADALAGRLAAKGYGTWVAQLPATNNGPALFSVRVGKYKTSKEAEAAMARLRKEEKLKPSLITR
jgi:septal ring-binding cell division protein DamX